MSIVIAAAGMLGTLYGMVAGMWPPARPWAVLSGLRPRTVWRTTQGHLLPSPDHPGWHRAGESLMECGQFWVWNDGDVRYRLAGDDRHSKIGRCWGYYRRVSRHLEVRQKERLEAACADEVLRQLEPSTKEIDLMST